MNKWILCLIGVLAFALTPGCSKKKKPKSEQTPSGPVDTSLPGDPVAGKKVYDKVCLACHAKDGKGNGGITGADFIADKTRLAKDNKVLINSVLNGSKTGSKIMPPQKGLVNEQQVKDALSYIRKNFGGTKK